MAKNPTHEPEEYTNGGNGTHGNGTPTFDVEEYLEKDFSSLPAPQTICGPWRVKIVTTYVDHGGEDSPRGSWVAIDLNMDPLYPVGEDAEDVKSELNMKDLPQIRQRVFITTPRQEREFVERVVTKFGVEPGKLRQMREHLRGAEAIATLTNTVRKGRSELKASYFRPAPDMTPPF